jgi:hypothetical protein
MSTITITLNDQDLDLGSFSADFNVEGAKLDDGFMTAAHVTGIYILQQLNDPEFQKKVWAFAETLVAQQGDGTSIGNSDQNPNAGQIAA